jgi:hypothetical protein
MKKVFIFILTLLRYSLAVCFAFFLSFWLAFLLAFLEPPFWLIVVVISFTGVFLPSFLFPSKSRRTGAFFLFLLGAGYYCVCFIVFWEPILPQLQKQWLIILMLILGGLSASGLHFYLANAKRRHA